MPRRLFFLLVLLGLVSSGCANSHYGYTESQWNGLSSEEQVAVKKEYETAIEARRQQKHRDNLEARKQSVIDLGNEKRLY